MSQSVISKGTAVEVKTSQLDPQGVYRSDSPPLISRVPMCSTFAGCQHIAFTDIVTFLLSITTLFVDT